MTPSSSTGADVSVVMGTYNGARFLRAQLRSILDQREPPGEIIVADDGSSDDTLAIADEVAAASLTVPVRVVRNPGRLGFADNFLAACAYATGRYIAFSDQDDLWYADKLSTCRAALEKHAALLVVHAVDDVDADGVYLRRNDQHIRRLRVREPLQGDPWHVFYGFTMLFERALLDKIDSGCRGKDVFTPGTPLAHDRWVYFLASSFGRTVTLPTSLAGYRQHAGQLYGGPPGRSLRQRVLDKLASGSGQLDYLAEVAEHRVALLTPLERAGDAAAARAVAHWQRRAATLRRSADIRTRPGLRGRLRRCLENLLAGGYRSPARGGFGGLYLLQDLAVACLPLTGAVADQPAAPARTESEVH